MNEAFEKIQERLNEIAKIEIHCGRCNGKTLALGYVKGIENAIKIVQEVAEEEHNNGWIPCSEKMPEEQDSIFAKLKGTDQWNNYMFEKISDDVNVTVEFEDGTRTTMTMHTIDGKWKQDFSIVKKEVIAWQPLPEPYNK